MGDNDDGDESGDEGCDIGCDAMTWCGIIMHMVMMHMKTPGGDDDVGNGDG